MILRFLMVFITLLSLGLALSLTACGQRGDPYRPSEIPNGETPSTSESYGFR